MRGGAGGEGMGKEGERWKGKGWKFRAGKPRSAGLHKTGSVKKQHVECQCGSIEGKKVSLGVSVFLQPARKWVLVQGSK